MKLLKSLPTIWRMKNFRDLVAKRIKPLSESREVILNPEIPDLTIKRISYKQFIRKVLPWQSEILTIGSEPAIYARDPNGWYGAFYRDELVGSLGSFPVGAHSTWKGYLYVQEPYRLKGFSDEIINTVVRAEKVKGFSDYSFVCVEDLTGMYEARDYLNKSPGDIIFKGNVRDAKHAISSKARPQQTSVEIINQLLTYDQAIHRGVSREPFCLRWLTKPYTELLVASNDQTVTGYGVISRARYPDALKASRIAPIYADSPEIASDILSACLGLVHREDPVFTDALGVNPQAAEVITSFALFKEYLRLARMVSGSNCEEVCDNSRVFSPCDYGTGP